MVTLFATIGFSLFGYDQGLMSGIIASKNFNTEFPMTKMADKNDVHHATIQGTVTAVYEVYVALRNAFVLPDTDDVNSTAVLSSEL
jgi:hypothetical protein